MKSITAINFEHEIDSRLCKEITFVEYGICFAAVEQTVLNKRLCG